MDMVAGDGTDVGERVSRGFFQIRNQRPGGSEVWRMGQEGEAIQVACAKAMVQAVFSVLGIKKRICAGGTNEPGVETEDSGKFRQ